MRSATLITNPSTDDGTFGVLLLDDHTSFCTAELPWRQNKNGISCIPPAPTEQQATYTCKMINSPKHGPCYQITDVPGRDMIEIHSANFAGDTAKGKVSQLLGCLALGKLIGQLQPSPDHPAQMAVLQSKQAIAEFEANMNGADFQLTIIRR